MRNPEERHIESQVGYTACKAHSNKVEIQTSNTSLFAAIILLYRHGKVDVILILNSRDKILYLWVITYSPENSVNPTNHNSNNIQRK